MENQNDQLENPTTYPVQTDKPIPPFLAKTVIFFTMIFVVLAVQVTGYYAKAASGHVYNWVEDRINRLKDWDVGL